MIARLTEMKGDCDIPGKAAFQDGPKKTGLIFRYDCSARRTQCNDLLYVYMCYYILLNA